jgi:hypothetical protein
MLFAVSGFKQSSWGGWQDLLIRVAIASSNNIGQKLSFFSFVTLSGNAASSWNALKYAASSIT